MKNSEVWAHYDDYTKGLTALGRQLGFGAAAAAWVLKLPEGAFTSRLLAALGLTVAFFVIDILQGLSAAVPLRVWLYRREHQVFRATGSIEGEYHKPRSLDSVPFALFLAKFLILLTAYGFLGYEILNRLEGSPAPALSPTGTMPSAFLGLDWIAVSAISTAIVAIATIVYVRLTNRLSRSAAENIAVMRERDRTAQERVDAEVRARALLLHRQLDSWFFDNPDLNDEIWKREVQSQFDIVERRFEEIFLLSKQASPELAGLVDQTMTHWLRGAHHLNLDLRFRSVREILKLVEWKLEGPAELQRARDALRAVAPEDPRLASLNPTNTIVEAAKLVSKAKAETPDLGESLKP